MWRSTALHVPRHELQRRRHPPVRRRPRQGRPRRPRRQPGPAPGREPRREAGLAPHLAVGLDPAEQRRRSPSRAASTCSSSTSTPAARRHADARSAPRASSTSTTRSSRRSSATSASPCTSPPPATASRRTTRAQYPSGLRRALLRGPRGRPGHRRLQHDHVRPRVFDIRDPQHPREIAYFNKPAPNTLPLISGAYAMSAPVFDVAPRGLVHRRRQRLLRRQLTNGMWRSPSPRPARRARRPPRTAGAAVHGFRCCARCCCSWSCSASSSCAWPPAPTPGARQRGAGPARALPDVVRQVGAGVGGRPTHDRVGAGAGPGRADRAATLATTEARPQAVLFLPLARAAPAPRSTSSFGRSPRGACGRRWSAEQLPGGPCRPAGHVRSRSREPSRPCRCGRRSTGGGPGAAGPHR